MISRRRLATAATIIMLGNVASRLLGLVREQVIAALFGPTATTSAFVAAATVPTMIYDLLIGGAISAALVPVFSDYAAKAAGDEHLKVRAEARRELAHAAAAVLTLAFLALALLVVALLAFTPQLVWLLAAGLDPAAQARSVALVRFMLPGVVFLGLSGVTTALLYARQMFGYPAFAVSIYNAGMIAFALLFAPFVGINSLALGIVAGAFGQLALQWPGLRDLRLRPTLDLRHPAVRRIVRLYAPVALGLIVTQVGVIVDRNLASHTGEDSMAVMRFATTLVQFPLGLTATALSFAILPALSRLGAAGDGAGYKATLTTGLRLVLLAILPATVGLLLLRVPLIQVLFEHGVFDARGTERTALAFLAYAPQLPFAAVDQVLIFAFYARQNTVTPMLVGVLGVLTYLVAGLVFIGPLGWGMPGLALANTVQNSLHAIVLFFLLHRAIGSLRGYGLGGTFAKAAAGSLALAAVWLLVAPLVATPLDLLSLSGRATYFVVGVALGAVVYALALLLLRTEELGALWRALAGMRRQLRAP